VRADEPHCLSETRGLTLDHRSSAFRCLIAWGKSGASRGDDESCEAVTHLDQCRGDSFCAVFGDAMIDHGEAVDGEMGGEPTATDVVAAAMKNAVTDRQDLCQQVTLAGGVRHVDRRYRIITMPSVSASWGRTRQPGPNDRHRPTAGSRSSTSKPTGVGWAIDSTDVSVQTL